jgi:hypothetical protein
MFEPLGGQGRRLQRRVGIRLLMCRVHFETARGANEPEIYESAIGQCTRTPLSPRLLVGARSRDLDVDSNLVSRREINRSDCAARVRYVVTQKPIGNEPRHASRRSAIGSPAGTRQIARVRSEAVQKLRIE